MLDIMRKNASGWIIKILFGALIVVFVFAFGMGTMDQSDPVLAYVDEEPIPVMEWQRAYRESVEAMRRQNPNASPEELNTPEFKQLILAQLINARLIRNEAANMGITVSRAEIRDGIGAIPAFQNQQKQFDPSLYKAVLAQNRLTPSQFEKDYEVNRLIQKVQEFIGEPARATEEQARDMFNWASERIRAEYILVSPQKLVDSVEVTDEDISGYYAGNKEQFKVPATVKIRYLAFTPRELAMYQDVSDDEVKAYYDANTSAFQQDEQVKARHILIKVDEAAGEDDVARAKKQIEKIAAQVKVGKDFAELARKNSEGPSAPNGGDLGWFGRGQMVKPFEDAAFALKKDEVSGPVRTRFGWHLIKVDDVREAGAKPFEDVKETIRSTIAEEKAAGKVTELLDNAVDHVATGKSLEDVGAAVGMVPRESNASSREALERAFGLKPEAVDTIFAMPKGETTNIPLAIEDGYLLAEKVDESAESYQEQADVEETIIAELKRTKAMEAALEEARTIAAGLKDPAQREETLAEYATDLSTSAPFGRQGFVPGLGMNQEFVNALFLQKDNEWLPEPFTFPTGAVVARLQQRIAPSDEEWQKQKEFWIASADRTMRDELFQSFMTNLRNNSDIEIVRPDLLN